MINLPATEWSCREVLDAKAVDPDGKSKCEFCGTSIRWMHVLEHEDYEREVVAGCCCAARYCFDYDAEGAEREVKNRSGRLMRFVDPRRWRRSNANPANIVRTVKIADKRKVMATVFLKHGTYGICIAGRGNDRSFHWERYVTQFEAKSVAFELVERLREAGE